MTARLKCLKPRLATSTPQGWKPDSQRGNRHERGYGYAWEQLRERIMLRDHGLCQPCKDNGHVTRADQVDHKTPKAHGGTDDESNLQAICTPCHRAKTSSESRR